MNGDPVAWLLVLVVVVGLFFAALRVRAWYHDRIGFDPDAPWRRE